MDSTLYQEGPDYIVTWDDGRVVCRYSKIHESSSGYSANLRVTANITGYKPGILYNAHLVFGGARSKQDAVRSCNARIPGEEANIDWTVIIEHSTLLVEQELETGEPITYLDEGPEPTERPYIIDKLLRYEEPTLIYGPGGANKSYLALALAACIAEGVALLDLRADKLKVLYLDYEDVEDTHKQRLNLIWRGWGMNGNRPHIAYKVASTSLVSMADSLSRQIDHEHIDVMITDSVALACGGEPEKASEATAFWRAQRALRLKGHLMLGHHPHGVKERPFGSIFWWNSTRSLWYQAQSEDRADNTTSVGLIHRKINNGKYQSPLGFQFRYTDTTTVVSQIDSQKIVDFRAELSVREQIFQAIVEQPGLTRKRLYEHCHDLNLELTPNGFRVGLHRLKAQIHIDGQDRIWLLDKTQNA